MSTEILHEDLNDDEYIVKCEQYTAYIDEHIANVKAAYGKLFKYPEKPFTEFHGIKGERLNKLLSQLEITINCHDSSKYLEEEFDGYRANFYPTHKEIERAKEDSFYSDLITSRYELAWFHHFTTNDHHPKYWKWVDFVDVKVPDVAAAKEGSPTPMKFVKQAVVLKTPKQVASPMKPLAILHMICDWEAMSIRLKSSTPDWYIKYAVDERKDLNPQTRVIVEELLTQLYGVEIPKVCFGDPGYKEN